MYFSASSSTQICIMFFLKLLTFKLTSWLVLTRKWHLSALPLKGFSNHLNRDIKARSRDSTTSSIFLAERYSVLSSTKFAISISLCIRNKYAKKCWIEVVPKLSLATPQTLQQGHSLYELLTLFSVFYVIDNHELILKQVD